MISKLERRAAAALEPAYDDLLRQVRTRDANLDDTGWREARGRAVLWTMATRAATAFRIAATKGTADLLALLGPKYRGKVTCDRAKTYCRLGRRQWCWAHLRRDFQAMVDRGGPAAALGEELLLLSSVIFEWWHRVRDGTWTRATFRKRLRGLRANFQAQFELGSASRCAQAAATCRELAAHPENLYLFAARPGIEPTNNAAEQALRHGVLWRKVSLGAASAAGSRFVERILSVVATCRQQGRDLLGYLTACLSASFASRPVPLLAPPPSAVNP